MYAFAVMDSLPSLERDFADIYREHYPRVRGLCRYLLRSDDAAQDAAQEVFLKARRRLSTYDPSRSLSSWLLKIASNHCIDVLRRRGLETRLFESEGSDAGDTASGVPGPLGQMLSDETGENVRRALADLPDKYRLPLVLIYYSEFSYEEVAAALGLGRNTVATLIFRGKQRLRKKLRPAGETA